MLQAGINCPTKAAVFLVDILQITALFGKLRLPCQDTLRTTVCRLIIHHDQFDGAVILNEDGFNTGIDKLFVVVAGDDDADQIIHFFSS